MYKIVAKLLADRLSLIASGIVFDNQFGFIKGRNIEDYIALSSKYVNHLDKKCFGNNVALKVDIHNA